MGKNVSFTQKWVKNLVKFPGSEKIFKNILKVLKKIKKGFFLQKWVKNLRQISRFRKNFQKYY